MDHLNIHLTDGIACFDLVFVEPDHAAACMANNKPKSRKCFLCFGLIEGKCFSGMVEDA
jgi:hypothetical protein